MTAPDLTPRNLLRRCLPHLRNASMAYLDMGLLAKEDDADSLCRRISAALAQPETPHPDTILLAEARERIKTLEGAATADGERLIQAAERAGITYTGCDTPDVLAETIVSLEGQIIAFEAVVADQAGRIAELERALGDAVSAGICHHVARGYRVRKGHRWTPVEDCDPGCRACAAKVALSPTQGTTEGGRE